jgi:hypothetical protein
VELIRSMGMVAGQAVAVTEPQINDLVIRSYLISFDEGSAAKRVAIGFASGGSELKVAVEGFQMTAQGLRKLGSGTTASGGGKGPGTAMGVATLVATNNPAGLIISTGVKVYGEKSGSAKVEGRAKETASVMERRHMIAGGKRGKMEIWRVIHEAGPGLERNRHYRRSDGG